jgi:hypothetical protein
MISLRGVNLLFFLWWRVFTASWEMNAGVSLLYGPNEKCAAEPTEGESAPQYKKKLFLSVVLLDADFQVAAFTLPIH